MAKFPGGEVDAAKSDGEEMDINTEITAFSQVLFMSALQEISASIASLLLSTQPVVTACLALLILGVQPTRGTIIGGLLILASVVCVSAYHATRQNA